MTTKTLTVDETIHSQFKSLVALIPGSPTMEEILAELLQKWINNPSTLAGHPAPVTNNQTGSTSLPQDSPAVKQTG